MANPKNFSHFGTTTISLQRYHVIIHIYVTSLLLVSVTSHVPNFSPSSLFLITTSLLVHLANFFYSTKPPSFFCELFFPSFSSTGTREDCNLHKGNMLSLSVLRCTTIPHHRLKGTSILDKGLRYPRRTTPRGLGESTGLQKQINS